MDRTYCPHCGYEVTGLDDLLCPRCGDDITQGPGYRQELADELSKAEDSTLRDVLRAYEDGFVGINLRKPDKTEKARLVRVRDDHFAVLVDGLIYSIPYSLLLTVVESTQIGGMVRMSGVMGPGYQLVLAINHMIIYKGGWSFEIEVPLG